MLVYECMIELSECLACSFNVQVPSDLELLPWHKGCVGFPQAPPASVLCLLGFEAMGVKKQSDSKASPNKRTLGGSLVRGLKRRASSNSDGGSEF